MNKTTAVRVLPQRFTVVKPEAWPRIYAYGTMFVIAVLGNLLVLYNLCWRRRSKFSSMNKLLSHLCLADLTVAFAYMAVEVYWRISIGWYAGELLCKLVQFFRAFGLYLSSLILVCISLDRYYAVVHPLKSMTGPKHVYAMLIGSWVLAALFAFPQVILFREESHPYFPEYKQCVTIWLGETAELVNTALSLTIIYFVPLIVIIFSYCNILYKLFERSRQYNDHVLPQNGSSSTVINRAKFHTLKLSIVIVLVFEICWTPFVTISLWYMIDRKSAENLDERIQDTLFMMSCATACVNSLVYGCFSHGHKRENHRRRHTLSRSNQSVVFKSSIHVKKSVLNKTKDDTAPTPSNSPISNIEENPLQLRHITKISNMNTDGNVKSLWQNRTRKHCKEKHRINK